LYVKHHFAYLNSSLFLKPCLIQNSVYISEFSNKQPLSTHTEVRRTPKKLCFFLKKIFCFVTETDCVLPN
jgi:hypothetical protein